jgi:hypothetical protein
MWTIHGKMYELYLLVVDYIVEMRSFKYSFCKASRGLSGVIISICSVPTYILGQYEDGPILLDRIIY